MILPVWKAKTSASLLVDKREKSMLSLRVFGADICKPPPPQKNKDESGTATPVQGQQEDPASGAQAAGAAVFEAEEAAILASEEDALNA